MKKYKYGTPGRVLNYAAPMYDKIMNFFMFNYDKNLANMIFKDISQKNSKINILDIGCGTGSITYLIAEKFNARICAGIDAAPKMVLTAKKKYYHSNILKFANAVSEHLPYKDNSFDCVVNTMFLHHIPYNSKMQTFREINRVLKPDGIVYTVDFSRPRTILGRAIIKTLAAALIQSEIAENAKYSLD